jgi:hypothetical protein
MFVYVGREYDRDDLWGFSGVRFWFGSVDGQAIVNLLQADSLVPTAVRDCSPLFGSGVAHFRIYHVHQAEMEEESRRRLRRPCKPTLRNNKKGLVQVYRMKLINFGAFVSKNGRD